MTACYIERIIGAAPLSIYKPEEVVSLRLPTVLSLLGSVHRQAWNLEFRINFPMTSTNFKILHSILSWKNIDTFAVPSRRPMNSWLRERLK